MKHIILSKRSLFSITAIAIVLLTSSCTHVSKQEADIIYTGGDIVTINDAQPIAEAVAVADGKIIAVGKKSDVLKHKGSTTKMVDLRGKTLMPGFFDAHSHLLQVTMWSLSADLYPPPMGTVDSMEKLKAALLAYKAEKKLKPGQWIIGLNYDDTLLAEKRHPTRDDLDQVSTDHPIFILHISGHLASANSKALELAGITAETEDPVGGRFVRRPGSKVPNGVMESNMAFLQVLAKVPTPSAEQAAKYFTDTLLNVYAANGTTTAQEAAGAFPPVMQVFRLAASKEKLPVDLIAYPKDIYKDMLANYEKDKEYHNGLRLGGLKLIYDGSIQGYTGYLSQPYHVPPKMEQDLQSHCDQTGTEGLLIDIDEANYPEKDDHDIVVKEGNTTFRGKSYYGSQEEADALVELALKNRWHLLAHTNGDAATDMLIESMRKGLKKYPVKDHRTTIIHAQMMREDQLDAAKELGLVPSFFPGHIYYWGDRHRDIFIGPERAARLNPMKSALDRGIPFTLHHDAAVTPANMLMVVQSAVHRVTSSGKPLGPEQEIPVMEALKAVTITAAWQEGEEKLKGSIEAGKLADLVILSANPLKVKRTNISDIEVMETIKEGKSIYKKP
jgi:predicted amidohydrolase YtcJ